MIEAISSQMPTKAIVPLLFAAVVGCFIAIAYLFSQNQQSRDIRIANACVVLTVVICLITQVVDDLATAFIVVGALTLVRLRAAIDETREFGFLLMSVAAGLGAGEKRYAIVLAGTAITCALAVLLAPRSEGAVQHRLSAILPRPQIDDVRAFITATCSRHKLQLRDADEGRSNIRVDFEGEQSLADDLIARMRSVPGIEDLRYEAQPWRES